MLADANQLVRDVNPFIMPPERVGLKYAAENYMMLKGGGGLTPWKAKKTPYMLEPMECMTSRLYSSVVFKGPARSGKSEALLKAQVAHSVKCDPSDVMIVHMNENESNYFSKVEVEPMLKATKDLRSCLSPISRDNNVSLIRTKAGNVIKMAWPVDATFRGKSFKYILLTDYDAIRAPGEGDVFTLSRMRTKSYQSSGMVLAESSPGHEASDLTWVQRHPHEAAPAPGIGSLYMAGDRRRFYWQCPDCGDFFIPEFEQLIFDRDEIDPVKAAQDVYMVCIHCGGMILETQKNSLNDLGKWLKQGQTIDQNRIVTGEGLKSESASFWLPGPVAGFSKWGADFAQKYVNAKNAIRLTNDDRGMQAFMNTDCGRTYIPEREDDISLIDLQCNREGLPLEMVPNEAQFLLASVDVQGGKHRRFVVQVHAIGENKKQWIVDRFEIRETKEGKPIKPNLYHEHWNELNDRVLDKWYQMEDGRQMKPLMMAYDTNGEPGVTDRSKEYYTANAEKYVARLFPVKGSSHELEGLVEKSKPEETKNKTVKTRRRRSAGVKKPPLYLLSTNKLKDIVSANMQVEIGLPKSMAYSKDLDSDFYAELIREQRASGGKWINPGGANEAFDLSVYVWAILVYQKWVNMDSFKGVPFKGFIREGNQACEDKPVQAQSTKPATRRRRSRQ